MKCVVAVACAITASTLSAAVIRGNAAPPRASAGFAYTPAGADGVSQYRVAHNGRRIPLSPATVPVHGEAISVVIGPTGRYVYVPEIDYSRIAQFRVRADGTLARSRPFEAPAHSHPTALVFAPDGQTAYLSCSHGAICQYHVRSNGTLAPLRPPAISAGPDPSGIRFDTSGRIAYVTVNAADGSRTRLQNTYRVARDSTLLFLKRQTLPSSPDVRQKTAK